MWQNAVKKRDNYTCQCCGKRYKDISVHHVFPFSDYEDLRFNVDNGYCLCKQCHDSRIDGGFHNIYGTQHNTPEQLREYIIKQIKIYIKRTHGYYSLLTYNKINELKRRYFIVFFWFCTERNDICETGVSYLH